MPTCNEKKQLMHRRSRDIKKLMDSCIVCILVSCNRQGGHDILSYDDDLSHSLGFIVKQKKQAEFESK